LDLGSKEIGAVGVPEASPGASLLAFLIVCIGIGAVFTLASWLASWIEARIKLARDIEAAEREHVEWFWERRR